MSLTQDEDFYEIFKALLVGVMISLKKCDFHIKKDQRLVEKEKKNHLSIKLIYLIFLIHRIIEWLLDRRFNGQK